MRIKELPGMNQGNSANAALFLVIPSFGDSQSVVEITKELEDIIDCPITVCILDDSVGIDDYPYLPENYTVFMPEKNLGQQRILTNFFRNGLGSYFKVGKDDLVIIMDGDGEDSPGDVVRMLEKIKTGEFCLVTAQRASRSVPISFKLGYLCFQIAGKVLTGKTINHGTFSISKRSELETWVKRDPFTQSFVGGLLSVSTSKVSVVCDRAPRRYGASRLDKYGLVTHGLKIWLSLGYLITARLLLATFSWTVISLLVGVLAIVLKFLGYAAPGWTTLIFGIIAQVFVILLVALLTTIGFTREPNEFSKSHDFTIRKFK